MRIRKFKFENSFFHRMSTSQTEEVRTANQEVNVQNNPEGKIDTSTGTENHASNISNPRKRNASLTRDIEEENEDEYFPPMKKFAVVSEDKVNDWEIPDDMLDYIKKHFNVYIKNADIQSNILNWNPVPNNMAGPATLDNYLRGLLEEQNKLACINEDKKDFKLQQKIINVMGPLGKLWLVLQNALLTNEEQVQVSMEDLNQLTEQSILLLGQVHNTVTHNRRINVLSNVMKESKVKQLLKDKEKFFIKRSR